MSGKHPLVQAVENGQLRKDVPDFSSGDTVVVQVRVKEGERERLQAFEGVVIAKRNRGLNSAFTVRKISSGIGVERVFQTHSPLIGGIEVKRRGDVRRAKLYYLRGLSGKKARIAERLTGRAAAVLPEAVQEETSVPDANEAAPSVEAAVETPAAEAQE